MWDIHYKNFRFRGISYCTPPNTLKSFCENLFPSEKPETEENETTSAEDIIKASQNFLPLKYGNFFKNTSDIDKTGLQADANSATPLLFEGAFFLYCSFLEHKAQYGTEKEKQLYKDMSILDFIQRLLTKRCASYFGKNENFVLWNGQMGQSNLFSKVGTDEEEEPLVIENCLTVDEMKLSSYIGISSTLTSDFVLKSKEVKRETVIIGLAFPRFKIKGRFDYHDIVINKMYNVEENGFGKKQKNLKDDSPLYAKLKIREVWGMLYNQTSYKSVFIKRDRKEGENFGNYIKNTRNGDIYNVYALSQRFSMATVTLLLEANRRASEANKMAYIFVDKRRFGFDKNCPKWMEEVFLRNFSYEILFQVNRPCCVISTIHFVDFEEIETLKHGWKMSLRDGVYGNRHPNEGIEIVFSSKKDMDWESIFEKDVLLVETYELNGNSLPGNEIWSRKISKEYGAPSNVLKNTWIPQIHNPHINSLKVCSKNLHLYDLYGVTKLKSKQFYY